MKQVKLQLYTQILIGMLCGVLVGLCAHHWAFSEQVQAYVKPLGTLFIKLITMIIVPLVFASLVVGTASLDNIRQLGRMGVKTMAFYMGTTVIAISGGLLLANVMQPGRGLSPETKTQLLEQSQGTVDTHKIKLAEKPALVDLLLDIVPRNPIRAFIDGNMLQVI
ncbi:MAG: dicarboxylate/amino acid:cation symporter, partial [Planctomycetes bacterium]|nr:dicarboxylate/amino acid:cation symporter [Planctomycetota bacterium]